MSICFGGPYCDCIGGQIAGVCVLVWLFMVMALALIGCGCYCCVSMNRKFEYQQMYGTRQGSAPGAPGGYQAQRMA
ncbi:hypothetical protein KIPB_002412 [Kipferlia bialata]|uniref:Uncharacterized protein n=1 Tax=Kipferlia bialata TaxID=797122 RepID=A0A9K3CRE5_9EUKA|nr:hypothetical protein KIPB_002412 [Kipferlia bialata]|eukprot:g2412.t1